MITVFEPVDAIRFPSGLPRPVAPMAAAPFITEEEVWRFCAPANKRVDLAWEGYAASIRQVNDHKELAHGFCKVALKKANLARQHLDLALLSGTAPCGPVEKVAAN